MSAPRLLLTRLDAEYGISFDDTCGVRQLEINPHHPAASSFPYANPAHLASLRAGMDARVGGQDEAQARPGAEACLNQASRATLGRASAQKSV